MQLILHQETKAILDAIERGAIDGQKVRLEARLIRIIPARAGQGAVDTGAVADGQGGSDIGW